MLPENLERLPVRKRDSSIDERLALVIKEIAKLESSLASNLEHRSSLKESLKNLKLAKISSLKEYKSIMIELREGHMELVLMNKEKTWLINERERLSRTRNECGGGTVIRFPKRSTRRKKDTGRS